MESQQRDPVCIREADARLAERALFGRDGIAGLANVDVTPELAVQVAMAYATTLKKGSTVTTSRDSSRAARALKRAVMAGLNAERLLIGAVFLGHGRRAFDDALAYVKERRQFGRPIGTFQAIRHRLADLATELECCRLLVADLARRTEVEPDKVLAREASMVKLKVTETARRVALEGMQMMGGYGYASEYGMERHVRNTLASTIYGGASEVQRDIIGKTYGL